MKTTTSAVLIPTLAAACLLASPAAWAQAAPAAGAAPAAASDLQTTVRTENGRRVYVAQEAIEIRGELQRPFAFTLSGRSSLGYTYLEMPMHFIDEIIRVVRREPF